MRPNDVVAPLGNYNPIRMQILRIRSALPAYAGVYMFGYLGWQTGVWTWLYVGRSHDLSVRPGSMGIGHDKFDPAIKLGATHVAFLYEPDENRRVYFERMLFDTLRPRLNEIRP